MSLFTTEEIVQYQNIINNTPAGDYELKDLFSSIWASITPTTFGKKFKDNYLEGSFSNITHITVKGDNHNLYSID